MKAFIVDTDDDTEEISAEGFEFGADGVKFYVSDEEFVGGKRTVAFFSYRTLVSVVEVLD